jgi:hypothetical protein
LVSGTQLGPALINAGFDATAVQAALPKIKSALEISLVEAPMPIQDALDLAEYFVHTTTVFTKFRRGAATVGGPVESAAITKHEGFRWVRRKHYFDDKLNPKGDENAKK